jgi:hypothetical protein
MRIAIVCGRVGVGLYTAQLAALVKTVKLQSETEEVFVLCAFLKSISCILPLSPYIIESPTGQRYIYLSTGQVMCQFDGEVSGFVCKFQLSRAVFESHYVCNLNIIQLFYQIIVRRIYELERQYSEVDQVLSVNPCK